MALQSMRSPDGRPLTVYLPPAFATRPRRPYPLLILHDGQNLFDGERSFVRGETWRLAESAGALIAAKAMAPIVICGIDHGGKDRIREMTPTAGPRGEGGGAAEYAKGVVEDVLPFVRRQFPVSTAFADTGLGGSSLGGLVTLVTALLSPATFGALLVMSPSIWWDRRWILRQIGRRPGALDGTRIWLDVGLDEGSKVVADARRLRTLLRRAPRPGTAPVQLGYEEAPGADHSERSWAARLPRALAFLFPPRLTRTSREASGRERRGLARTPFE